MPMKLINVIIKGSTPYLMHRFTEQDQEAGATRRSLVVRGTPREEAEKKANVDQNGHFYFPGAAIGRLLRDAGSNHKLRGSRRSARHIVPAAVLVLTEAIILSNGDGNTPAESFEVDSRPVVIPSTKGRIMCHRPRFECWSGKFTLRINELLLPTDFVQQLLNEGGQQIGVGDYRPEKGGPFGTFNVILWSEHSS